MIKSYYMLTKPGIIMGNVITTAAGFMLASKGHFEFGTFFATLIGLSFVIGSACVFNNYIDRHADEKMARTKNRALAKGLISGRSAIVFAIFLMAIGILILSLFTNVLSVAIASAGCFIYIVLYSIYKYHTVYGTLIGSFAGAVPPAVGYCAVSNHFDMGALILFSIIALWQMPHFFAIAIYRLTDYAAAGIPVLPIVKGMQVTKIHMVFYIIAFILAASLLTVFGYTGYGYLAVASLLGVFWLGLCLKGFKADNDKLWARNMFLFSLVVVMGLCITIAIDVLV